MPCGRGRVGIIRAVPEAVMSISNVLVDLVIFFSMLCMVAVVFFERKNPTASLAWVLVLLFLPVVGFIAYLFLGTGFRVKKKKKYSLKARADNQYGDFISRHLNLASKSAYVGCHQDFSRLVSYLNNASEGVFTADNSAEVFTGGKEMFARLIEDIGAAKDHIHLLFYIFRDDRLGREIVGLLTKKVREGLEVRLMYDSVGSMLSFDPMFKELKKAGGAVLAFSPIFSTLSSHLRLNYRNHRKIAVIDGRVGYVGGMNVGVEYMGENPKLSPWRDTHLRITGSAVWFLQERFLMDWAFASDHELQQLAIDRYFPEPTDKGNLGMQIVSSGPDTYESPLKSGLVAMLYSARKNIYLQTPYFAPDQSFLDALRIAAHSGVDVRIMLPAIGDYDIVHRATLGYAREAAALGIKIYLYPGFIHAKTVTVDGQVATIGTTNITNRSFTLDFEVNAFVYDQDFAKQCEDIFLKDQAISRQIDSAYFAAIPLAARASYNFARLLAPMM